MRYALTEQLLLVVFLASVWSILPILLLRYVFVVLPTRIEEITVLFANGSATARYLQLFVPREFHAEGEAMSPQTLTQKQFWRVHSVRQYALAFVPLGVVTAILLVSLYLWAAGQLKDTGGNLPA